MSLLLIAALTLHLVPAEIVTNTISNKVRAQCEALSMDTTDLGTDPSDAAINAALNELMAGDIGTIKLAIGSVPTDLCTGPSLSTYPQAICNKKGWVGYAPHLEQRGETNYLKFECWDLSVPEFRVRVRIACPDLLELPSAAGGPGNR